MAMRSKFADAAVAAFFVFGHNCLGVYGAECRPGTLFDCIRRGGMSGTSRFLVGVGGDGLVSIGNIGNYMKKMWSVQKMVCTADADGNNPTMQTPENPLVSCKVRAPCEAGVEFQCTGKTNTEGSVTRVQTTQPFGLVQGEDGEDRKKLLALHGIDEASLRNSSDYDWVPLCRKTEAGNYLVEIKFVGDDLAPRPPRPTTTGVSCKHIASPRQDLPEGNWACGEICCLVAVIANILVFAFVTLFFFIQRKRSQGNTADDTDTDTTSSDDSDSNEVDTEGAEK